MTSLWLDRPVRSAYDDVAFGNVYDVVVVGAGLTGLVTAHLAAQSGKSVAVIEAREIGAVTTGNTTAKISLLQGTKLSSIASKHPRSAVRSYVDANRAGQSWLVDYCRSKGVAVQTETAYTYATTDTGLTSVRRELAVADTAGLPVFHTTESELPFDVMGAVGLAEQAQFDPLDALLALADDIRTSGGHISEHARVMSARHTRDGIRLTVPGGSIVGTRIVLATGTPILDRGLFFSRLEPLRSYAVAFEIDGPIPRGMYLSADSLSRSIRYAPTSDGERLLIGGNGHTVGRESSEQAQVDDLVDWTGTHFPGARVTHSWSAQDYESIDVLPYAGPLVPGDGFITVATGYDKWGMTAAVAAALHLDAASRGEKMPWSNCFALWNPRVLRGATSAIRMNGAVVKNMATGWVSALSKLGSTRRPAEGTGRVGGGILPRATCTVDGVTHDVSAVCPHLGGILRFNDAEKSWDCPLHGSRFAADGTVLEGPATHGLSSRDA
ncbi:FAD-dependent oxidoreductase [Rhodococcoides trifolii]|nr:FAD-dependent oxidoreductase [Rhodococcus trifolii]